MQRGLIFRRVPLQDSMAAVPRTYTLVFNLQDAAARGSSTPPKSHCLKVGYSLKWLFQPTKRTGSSPIACFTGLAKSLIYSGVGEYIAKVAFLIRARSVVQVHPGPPFKSPVNTRLFSLFPFRGIYLTILFANYLPTFRAIRGHYLPEHSEAPQRL